MTPTVYTVPIFMNASLRFINQAFLIVSKLNNKKKLIDLSESLKNIKSYAKEKKYNEIVKILIDHKIIDEIEVPEDTDFSNKIDIIVNDSDTIIRYIDNKLERYKKYTNSFNSFVLKNIDDLEDTLKDIVCSIKESKDRKFISLCNNEVASIMRSANELQGIDIPYITDYGKRIIEYGILTLRRLRF